MKRKVSCDKQGRLKFVLADAEIETINKYLDLKDQPALLEYLGVIVKDHKDGIRELSKMTGITREGLYKILSREGNPTITSLFAVLQSIGAIPQLSNRKG